MRSLGYEVMKLQDFLKLCQDLHLWKSSKLARCVYDGYHNSWNVTGVLHIESKNVLC